MRDDSYIALRQRFNPVASFHPRPIGYPSLQLVTIITALPASTNDDD